MTHIVVRYASIVDLMIKMPELIASRLTFAVVTSVFDGLVARPSDLKRERLVLASLLSAEAEDSGQQHLRVEVSPAHGAGPGPGTDADIAIRRGGIAQELFLVVPRSALPEAMTKHAPYLMEQEDLPRVHILTEAESGLTEAETRILTTMASGGLSGYQDVSVLDIKSEIRSLTARLPRKSRATALLKLDKYLRTKLADPRLADEYVLSLCDLRPDIVRRSRCHAASKCCLHDSVATADCGVAG